MLYLIQFSLFQNYLYRLIFKVNVKFDQLTSVDNMTILMPKTTVLLPVYPGFTKIAIWPSPNSVSFGLCLYWDIAIYDLFQTSSFYGLQSIKPFSSEMCPSGAMKLPFYQGCLYVAYQSDDPTEV